VPKGVSQAFLYQAVHRLLLIFIQFNHIAKDGKAYNAITQAVCITKELLENNLSKSLRRRYPIIPLAMELMPADIELFKLLL